MSGSERPAATAGGAAGFTLLELLVAITVAMILLAAAPGLVGRGSGALEDAVSGVAAELRLARERAVAEGRDAGVAFDPERRAFRADDGGFRPLPAGVEIGLETAAEARAELGAPGFLFFPEGGSTGGVVALRRGEAVARIEVRWLTGAVRVE
jgi:general secretion pathway protein H